MLEGHSEAFWRIPGHGVGVESFEEIGERQTLTSSQPSAFEAGPHRLPHPAVDREISKFEANLAEVLLGFVMHEGSDYFLQRIKAVDNGLQTIGHYRPIHVLLTCRSSSQQHH